MRLYIGRTTGVRKGSIQLTKIIHYYNNETRCLPEGRKQYSSAIKATTKMDVLPDIRKITFVSSNGHYDVFRTMFFQFFHPLLQCMKWILSQRNNKWANSLVSVDVVAHFLKLEEHSFNSTNAIIILQITRPEDCCIYVICFSNFRS